MVRLPLFSNTIRYETGRKKLGWGAKGLRLDVCVGLEIVVKLLGGVSRRRDNLV